MTERSWSVNLVRDGEQTDLFQGALQFGDKLCDQWRDFPKLFLSTRLVRRIKGLRLLSVVKWQRPRLLSRVAQPVGGREQVFHLMGKNASKQISGCFPLLSADNTSNAICCQLQFQTDGVDFLGIIGSCDIRKLGELSVQCLQLTRMRKVHPLDAEFVGSKRKTHQLTMSSLARAVGSLHDADGFLHLRNGECRSADSSEASYQSLKLADPCLPNRKYEHREQRDNSGASTNCFQIRPHGNRPQHFSRGVFA